VDGFGNIITNLKSEQFSKLNIKLNEKLAISVGRRRISGRYVKTYSDLDKDEFGLLEGSHGLLEIACRERSAAKRIGARNGMRIRVSCA
jgi:S-adenosylmethionine hydrolase